MRNNYEIKPICSNRHAFRASWHDYGSGVYFVTICAHEKQHLFGNISDGAMDLSEAGLIASDCIKSIPAHNDMTEIWNYIVMPNHVHMVISVGARYIAPAQSEEISPASHSLGCLKPPKHGEECEDYHHNSRLAVIIGTYKAAVTRMTRSRCIAPLQSIWQRSFHEHIIRDQRALENIMNYIDNNIARWDDDCFNIIKSYRPECLSNRVE